MENKTIDGLTVKIGGIAWLLQEKDRSMESLTYRMCKVHAIAIDKEIMNIPDKIRE